MPERTAFCLLIFLTKFRTIVPIRFLEQLKEKIIFFVDAPFFFFCLSIKTFRTKLRRRRRRCRICQRFKDVLTIKHYGPPWWFSDVKGNYLDNLANVLWCKFDDSKIIWQRFLDVERRFSERRLWRCFATLFFGWAIQDVFLLPHVPQGGQGGSILLVHYSMIIRYTAIFDTMTVVRYDHIPIYHCL